MHKKYIQIIIFLFLVLICKNTKAQQNSEIIRLSKIIKNQIKIDAEKQDSNLILFTLPVCVRRGNTKMPINKSTSNTKFCYSGGYNIRFYVLSSNRFSNDAHLKIYKSGKYDKSPKELFQKKRAFFYEIVDSAKDNNISYFDYQLYYYEEFEVVLSLNPIKAGCAIAIVTVYPTKKKNK